MRGFKGFRVFERLCAGMEPRVFFGAALVVIGFVVLAAVFTDATRTVFQGLQTFIVDYFGWFYILATSFFLGFVVWLLFSRHGGIRLGGDRAEPEFGYFSWFTMLFSAGMGTGLVFWGVAEPLTHHLSPPTGEGETLEATRQAMRFAYFHWGLHPWAIYIVFGLSVAYFHFRHQLPLAPRSLLYPIIGERIHGWIGHGVDILCSVGTLFGVATSLGLGAMQVNTGIARMGGVPYSVTVQVILIVVITGIATISVVTGIRMGIRRLSQFNILLAAAMFVFVLFAGPTVHLLKLLSTSVGDYLQHLIGMSFWMDLREDSEWQDTWTLFYWGWWISWAPFVGVFVARISKGRTIREFIVSVLLVPTLVTFAWFAVFGGTGLYLEREAGAGIARDIEAEPALSLHLMLEHLPWAPLMTALGTLLVVIFFVTSSDSGSLVIDMVTAGGRRHPPRAQRVFWALSEGAVAALLLVAGGLQALRTAAITAGLPMAVMLILTCLGLARALRVDQATDGLPSKARLRREE